MEDKKILEITEDVKWIGVLDPDLETFDIVMITHGGTTYNSYFINAQKKTIVDTTKDKFWDVYLAKLLAVTKPEEIDYIIINHSEPDHSGNLKNLLKLAPNATVVGSGNVVRYLKDLMNMDFPHIIVKDGDTLDLGNKTIRFIGAPNLHWPDTMYSYLEEDKLLFSCDSFSAHYCHPEMLDDKVDYYDDAFQYYFIVIMEVFSKFVLKAIEKIRPLDIQAICTGHGPILTHDWKRYVDLTEKYAREALAKHKNEHVMIAYVSAYGNTKMMAEAIANGLKEHKTIEVELCDLEDMSIETIEFKMIKATAYIIGSPTINQNTFLPIYMMFSLLSPLSDRGKLAGCFGSYGWGGEVQKIIECNLSNLKLNLFPESIFIKFTPSAEDLNRCYHYGFDFGTKMLELNCVAKP